LAGAFLAGAAFFAVAIIEFLHHEVVGVAGWVGAA
jgi:hypothetical protein